jgi:subtilase family serine protease
VAVQRRIFRIGALTGLAAIGASGVLAAGAPALAAPTARPDIVGHIFGRFSGAQPPTSAQCLAANGLACYDPAEIRAHYNLDGLHDSGITGKGKTIVIVDSYGSPTIASDLQTFDAAFHLPAASLSIIQPVGAVPPFDPTNSTMVGWAEETTLDVEWSHTIAPGAKILLVETPVAEVEGSVGFPQIVAAENYVINHHLGDVISQSFGATEPTFSSPGAILGLRSAFKNAAEHNVTVLAASGDNGATDNFFDTSCCFAHHVNSWPSSDPLVTSVGGTEIVPRANGTPESVSHDVVWQDPASIVGGPVGQTCCAGGGGPSAVFSRPDYQNSVAGVVGESRGTPDISMSASLSGAVLVYWSFQPFGPGYFQIAGTSEASPIFSGIVAMADQLAGHDLGQLNRRLYELATTSNNGIVDVTKGGNGMTFPDAHQGNAVVTVAGYNAGPGYDMASGLGTINAAVFIPALVAI